METRTGDDVLSDTTVSLGPLPELVGYLLRRAQLAVFADFLQHFAVLDLRPAQYSTLIVLRHNPGSRPSQIADALGIKRANFVVLQTELAGRGLIERRTDARDRRAHTLYLTAAGAALMVQADAALAEHELGVAATLGQVDYDALLRILNRFTPSS